MKIHSATTNLELPFRPIMDDSPIVHLPAGTEVTAIEVGDQRWHLNTKHEGRDYDRYVSTACLQVGPAIAAFNEGADSFFADSPQQVEVETEDEDEHWDPALGDWGDSGDGFAHYDERSDYHHGSSRL